MLEIRPVKCATAACACRATDKVHIDHPRPRVSVAVAVRVCAARARLTVPAPFRWRPWCLSDVSDLLPSLVFSLAGFVKRLKRPQIQEPTRPCGFFGQVFAFTFVFGERQCVLARAHAHRSLSLLHVICGRVGGQIFKRETETEELKKRLLSVPCPLLCTTGHDARRRHGKPRRNGVA